MKLRSLVWACTTLASVAAFSVSARAADTLGIQYFDIGTPGHNISAGSDFGICCSSGPATGEGNLSGTSLSGGKPVDGAGGNIMDVSSSGQILWWTPGTLDNAYTIKSTGSGVVSLSNLGNMFAPNSTGSNDTYLYETAILSGNIKETGGPASLYVSSDDDALVYLNGVYIGGNPGVHPTEGSDIALPNFSGTDTLKIFFADRAEVGANLNVSVVGAVTSAVPEAATWAMMLLGMGGIGAAMRSSKRKALAASAAA